METIYNIEVLRNCYTVCLSLCPILASDSLYLVRPLGFDEHDVIQNKALVAIFRSERGQTTKTLRIVFVLWSVNDAFSVKREYEAKSCNECTKGNLPLRTLWRRLGKSRYGLNRSWPRPRWRWMVSFTPWPLYLPGRRPRWVDHRQNLDVLGMRKISYLLGIKPRIFQPTVWSLRCHGLPSELTPNI